MQVAHIRNQFNLFGKKTSLIAFSLLLFCTFNTFGQRVIKLPDYDRKKLHYGFQIGILQSGMHLKRVASSADSINTRAIWGPGFSVGFNMTFALQDELWSLRVLPNVAFYQREIEKTFRSGKEPTTLQGGFNVINLPLMLKYKASRRRNSRMYMVAGLTPSYLVSSNIPKEDDEKIELLKSNLEISYGFGFDFYFQLFKFAPEIRFSHGLRNVLKPSQSTSIIQSATTHRVSLYLNFE